MNNNKTNTNKKLEKMFELQQQYSNIANYFNTPEISKFLNEKEIKTATYLIQRKLDQYINEANLPQREQISYGEVYDITQINTYKIYYVLENYLVQTGKLWDKTDPQAICCDFILNTIIKAEAYKKSLEEEIETPFYENEEEEEEYKQKCEEYQESKTIDYLITACEDTSFNL